MNKEQKQAAGNQKTKKLNARDKQTIRFLKWIQRYGGFWYVICTPGHENMGPGMMKSMIERLYKEGFYELIFVILMVYREREFVDHVLKSMLLDMILETWEGRTMNKEWIIKRILQNLT